MALVCRACLQAVDFNYFTYIDTFDNAQITSTVPKHLLTLCVPELDLYISEQPGICHECLTMFEHFYNFKNRCLASEDKILSYMKKHKIGAQRKVNLTCVIYDVVEHMLYTPEEPEKNKPALEDNPNQLPNASLPIENLPDSKEVFTCNKCSFVTMDQKKLEGHTCLTVSVNEKYKCPFCDYVSGRRYRLSYHINCKHGTNMPSHDCQECDFKSPDFNSLKKHQKLMHKKPEELKVPVVKEKIVSLQPQLHGCNVCDYKTKDKSNLRKHLYTHGGKPKKCELCSYQCVSPYQMARHFKKSHV